MKTFNIFTIAVYTIHFNIKFLYFILDKFKNHYIQKLKLIDNNYEFLKSGLECSSLKKNLISHES